MWVIFEREDTISPISYLNTQWPLLPPPPMLLDLYQNCYFSPIKHILWEIVGRFYMRILCMSLQNNRLEV